MQSRNPNHAKGVDVSHWQGQVDWAQVKSAGYSFAILKATEGHTGVDDMVYINYNNAKKNGLAVGLYHYTRATTTAEAIAEAEFFCSVLDACGGPRGIDIPPILDIEPEPPNVTADYPAICKAWCDVIEKKYGVKPMIYSYGWFIDTYLNDTLKDYPLWLADYDHDAPPNHAGWANWTFVQHTDKGSVPGIHSAVDVNEFNGGVDVLLYRMDQQVAKDLIAVCRAHYALATSQQDKDAWHTRAEEIRKVSGLPADA